jgi:ABC-2 type transport system permease protein
MIPAIKSEFRKLLTVRSTYFIVAISLAITAFFAGYIQGYLTKPAELAANPHMLQSQSTGAIIFVGLILAFAGLLLAGHEYRYNTIMYTLTTSNRRLKVLGAKFLVITVYAVVTSVLVMFFSPLCAIIGVHLAGHTLPPQTFHVWDLLWRCAFTGWGYAMYAFVLIMILRNQIGAIVTFLMVPLIGENILALLLKHNSKYLPFTALQSVAEPGGMGNSTTSSQAATTVLIYVAVTFTVGAILFIRRDAN